MQINPLQIQSKILNELHEMYTYNSNEKPIVNVNVYSNDKFGSFNISYIFPIQSDIHNKILAHVKKDYPKTNRIMTFCQGIFGENGTNLQSQCFLTTEDGAFITNLPKKIQRNSNKIQNEFQSIIRKNISPSNSIIPKEIQQLIERWKP